MHKATLGLVLVIAGGLSAAARGQASPTRAPAPLSDAPPLYRVLFERGEAVPGISATFAIKWPWECASDGTIFVSFVSTVPVDSGLPPPPPVPPPMLLTSVSPSGRGQTFRLDQVPELYISSEVDHYASDSDVVFLVKASRENKPVKETYSFRNDYHGEYTRNAAEQHLYIVSFSREGEYRRTVEIEDTFSMHQIGVFPSGTFLAFGFDKKDHSPRLVMLKEDGTLLQSLQIPKGGAPESMVSGADAPRPHAVASAELVPMGRSILVVQNNTTFPLLEVNEGGMIRAIHPKLPKGDHIEAVIPADRNLYVVGGPETDRGMSAGVIYEVSPEGGSVLRRFELGDGRRADGVACIHDGKFLSIDYGEGKVVPLIGSAEPATAADQQKR